MQGRSRIWSIGLRCQGEDRLGKMGVHFDALQRTASRV